MTISLHNRGVSRDRFPQTSIRYRQIPDTAVDLRSSPTLNTRTNAHSLPRPCRVALLGFLLGSGAAIRPLAAQEVGRIVGRVVDAEQGSPVAGAQTRGGGHHDHRQSSALDGRYALQAVPAGPVSIRVRMIGFAPKVVTGVVVPAGGTIAQDIALAASAVQLAEISVSAEAERGTVNRALDEQRNATNIVSSVSAEQIARSPDSDAGQAVQRVSGVTVQDGKYVFVRGLGERYTTTSLNGARIPSPDPERKVVPLDLFPSRAAGGNHHIEDVHPRPAGRLQRRGGERNHDASFRPSEF